jgi:nucleoside-diphosphate-sugar epimerase
MEVLLILEYANQSTDSYTTFVTGSNGLLGRWLLPELTRRGQRVLALLRNAHARSQELWSWIESHGGHARMVSFVEGDLDAPRLGIAPSELAQLQQVRRIFHLAANFRWGLSTQAARRTNVDGTLRVLEIAARLSRLDRFVGVGGYRTGERVTANGERYLPDPKEAKRYGPYETSRREAIQLVRERSKELGIAYSLLHPGSVIGDSRTGETTQLTGIGEYFVALARGHMPGRVGGPRTFLPLVTVDLVARALAEMAEVAALANRELSLLDPNTPELDVLVDRACRSLGLRAPRHRVPLWLLRTLPEWFTRAPRESLSFFDDARYVSSDTDAWLASRGLAHAEIGPAFDRWLDALVRKHVPEARFIGTPQSNAAS